MECCICTEDLFGGRRTVVALKCGHVVHKDCCDSWSAHKTPSTQSTCPICRAPYRKNDYVVLFVSKSAAQLPTPQPRLRHLNNSPRVQNFRKRCEENRLNFSLRKQLMESQKRLACLRKVRKDGGSKK